MNPVEGTSASEIEALRRALDEKLSVEAADEWLSYRFHQVCDERDSLAERLRQLQAHIDREIPWTVDGAYERMEERLRQTEEALRQIEDWTWEPGWEKWALADLQAIALAALAPADPQEPA